MQNSPFLCTFCGQSAGKATPEQLHLAQQQRMQERHQRRIAGAVRAEKNREWRKEAGAHMGRIASETGVGMARLAKEAAFTSLRELKNLPARTDGALRIIAGRDNNIIFWFLRIVVVVLLVGLLFGIGVGLVSLVISIAV